MVEGRLSVSRKFKYRIIEAWIVLWGPVSYGQVTWVYLAGGLRLIIMGSFVLKSFVPPAQCSFWVEMGRLHIKENP